MRTQPYRTPYRYLSLPIGWLYLMSTPYLVLHCCLAFCHCKSVRRSRAAREPTFLGDSEYAWDGNGSLIRRWELDLIASGCETSVATQDSRTSSSKLSVDASFSNWLLDEVSTIRKVNNSKAPYISEYLNLYMNVNYKKSDRNLLHKRKIKSYFFLKIKPFICK